MRPAQRRHGLNEAERVGEGRDAPCVQSTPPAASACVRHSRRSARAASGTPSASKAARAPARRGLPATCAWYISVVKRLGSARPTSASRQACSCGEASRTPSTSKMQAVNVLDWSVRASVGSGRVYAGTSAAFIDAPHTTLLGCVRMLRGSRPARTGSETTQAPLSSRKSHDWWQASGQVFQLRHRGPAMGPKAPAASDVRPRAVDAGHLAFAVCSAVRDKLAEMRADAPSVRQGLLS